MDIRFRLRGTKSIKKIYVRFFHNKIDLMVWTNLVTTEEGWDCKSESIVENSAQNESLQSLKLDILKGYNSSFSKGQVIDKNWLQSIVSESFSRPKFEAKLVNPAHTLYVSDFCQWWMQNHASSWKVSARQVMGSVVKSQYQKFADMYAEYESETGTKNELRKLTTDDIYDFVTWMEEAGYMPETIKRNVTRLKFFLLRAVEHGMEVSTVYKQTIYIEKDSEELESVYLNENEIEAIYGLDFSHDDEMDNVRDLLIISCYSGLRVSDLMEKLNTENIKDGFISVKTKKTGSFVKIPVHPFVKSILNKRFGHLPRKMRASDYNLKIKTVAMLAHIDNQVYGKLFDSDKKRKVVGYFRKYELIASHVGRKSFVSNLRGKIGDEALQKLAGWSSDKMLQKYTKTTKTEYAEVLAIHWRK